MVVGRRGYYLYMEEDLDGQVGEGGGAGPPLPNHPFFHLQIGVTLFTPERA